MTGPLVPGADLASKALTQSLQQNCKPLDPRLARLGMPKQPLPEQLAQRMHASDPRQHHSIVSNLPVDHPAAARVAADQTIQRQLSGGRDALSHLELRDSSSHEQHDQQQHQAAPLVSSVGSSCKLSVPHLTVVPIRGKALYLS